MGWKTKGRFETCPCGTIQEKIPPLVKGRFDLNQQLVVSANNAKVQALTFLV
jgi:hypothetical protein